MPDLTDDFTTGDSGPDLDERGGDGPFGSDAATAMERSVGVTMDELIDAAIFRRLFGVLVGTQRAEIEGLNPRDLIVGDIEDPDDGDLRWRVDVDRSGGFVQLLWEEFSVADNAWNFHFIQRWNGTNMVFAVPQAGAPGTADNFMVWGTSDDPLTLRGDLDIEGRFGLIDVEGTPNAAFASLSDGDATPDISGRAAWQTANTSATTITAFDSSDNDDGLKEVFILLINDDFTTIDFSQSTLQGNGGVPRTFGSGDVLLCVRKGGTGPVTACSVPSSSPSGNDPHASDFITGGGLL